ncbi:MaoC/PaaZ C-terminal domain-containing protein [Halorientalis salina]|uniref:MaoC/PaaZ C-terminal domain-containing protein n=1 Tax=Halorientalis salina TaxID=2932266 RepID=UPI0010ACD511|nr:MaoC/PaaZ C-terminal domain-containing protein [Halorientalis salina]
MSDETSTAADSYFESVEVGETAETEARTITEADVVNFAGVSGDFNHLHMDAERMAESQFGERIAHGTLVFSIATGLLWQSRSERERESLVAFYGVDNLRFVGPVTFGDTIHVETEVVEKREKPDHPVAGGVLHTEAEIKKQTNAPVITCEFLSLMQ